MDNLTLKLFEHAFMLHGYLLGTLLTAGRTGEQAWAELGPIRAELTRLAALADVPVPDHWQKGAFYEPLSEEDAREGSLYFRVLPDGGRIAVYPLSVAWGQLAFTRAGHAAIDDSYYYETRAAAIEAARTWDGKGDAPVGWFRHPQSGRRRPDGDPAKEHVQP